VRGFAAVLSGALALVGTGVARADERSGPGQGVYVGIGGVYALEDFDYDSSRLGTASIFGPDVKIDFDDSTGVDLLLGWRFHRRLSLELTYEFLEGFDSTEGAPDSELDTHHFLLGLKLYGNRNLFEPYLLVGVGGLLVEEEVEGATLPDPFRTDLGFAMRFGGGLDFWLDEHFGVEVEVSYLIAQGGLAESADMGLFALHFLYHF